MIEVRKGQDRIPCDPNANLDTLVQTHGADSVLVDGISVADQEAAANAEEEAAANAEEEENTPAEPTVESSGVVEDGSPAAEVIADAPAPGTPE